jgi:hypothetical protein
MKSLNVILVLALVLDLQTNGFAYVDPNAGGYVFQTLFPLFSGLVAFFLFFKDWTVRTCKGLWHRLRGTAPSSNKKDVHNK